MIVLVAGAGGFIGGHLVGKLLQEGHRVRAVDIKPEDEWHQSHKVFPKVDDIMMDLRNPHACHAATVGVDRVYNLACDMGGMGFIESHKTDCMVSVLINTNLLITAAANRVKRYFYASSACVYNADRQALYVSAPLREEDAYPAMPEDGYGWEKLFGERMCRHFAEDRGIETRVARLHNVYGSHGTWRGGREKAPAALCRKVLEAQAAGSSELQIWGTGHQTRSFTYIDDCIHGISSIMDGAYPGPVNLGSAELVSIDELVDLIEEVAQTRLVRVYEPGAPGSGREILEQHTLPGNVRVGAIYSPADRDREHIQLDKRRAPPAGFREEEERMTMATNGKQIEELLPGEKNKELRLRYSGALSVLVDAELRVSAARLIATYPLVSEEIFVERAREAFRHVVGEVCLGARDARHDVSEPGNEGMLIDFDIIEYGKSVGKVSLLTSWSEKSVLEILESQTLESQGLQCLGHVPRGVVLLKGWPTVDTFEMAVVRDGGCARYFKFVAVREPLAGPAEQASRGREDGHAE